LRAFIHTGDIDSRTRASGATETASLETGFGFTRETADRHVFGAAGVFSMTTIAESESGTASSAPLRALDGTGGSFGATGCSFDATGCSFDATLGAGSGVEALAGFAASQGFEDSPEAESATTTGIDSAFMTTPYSNRGARLCRACSCAKT
jgi:hypothetical protein